MLNRSRNFFRKNKSISDYFQKLLRYFNIFILKNFKRSLKTNPDKKLIYELSDKSLPNVSQIKQIRHFLNEKEKKVVNISLFVFMICFVWLITRIIWNMFVEVPRYGGEYTEGVVGSVQYINPILNQSNDVDRDLSVLIYSGLFKINKDGEIENDLVKNYSVGDDNKTYTFELKDNVLWHDEEKLTSDDVGYTLSVIQDPNYKSSLYKTFQGIEFEKIDDKSFKITLPEEFVAFPSVLTFGILPAHLWENITPENFTLTELNKKPIGSGPFKYESFKKDSNGLIKQYKLEAFDDFYNKKPYLSTIIFKFYNDTETLIDALNSNQVSGIGSVLESDLKNIKSSKSYSFYSIDTPRYSALFFNPKQNDILRDLSTRQALSLAIDKKELEKEISTSDKEAYGPLDFIIDPKEDEFNFDKAKKLLADNGWTIDSKDQILKKKDKKFEVTITSVDNADYVNILQYIKKQWNALGIVTNLEIIPKNKINSQVIIPRQYQILLHGQAFSYDIDPYPFWHSSQTQTGLNLSIFTDSEIDVALESARKILDFNQRLDKYKKFQEILKKDNFAIFLFRPSYHYIVDKSIKGIDTKVVYISSDRFSNVTNWYIKTKKAIKK